ncbi:MAG: GAF domain-containing sensor histidine kinase [Chloroflexota bacterium]|nr:GAF domain-containing sensor histidine kinase [Chloroflexota bacterium]
MRERDRRVFPRRLEIAALVLPSALFAGLALLDFTVLETYLPPGISHLVFFALGVAGVAAFSYVIFDRIRDLQLREIEQRRRQGELADALDRRGRQLQALNEAGLSLAAELESASVLQKIVDLARVVGGSKYAALGMFNENGEVVQFLTSGIGQEERARIGPLPRGRGLLGLLQDEQRPIRLRSIAEHAASVGFPPGHPAMTSFLGVPILWRGRSVGNLYLTEKIGAEEFSAEDEGALLTLAAQAAIAIENARLYEQVGRISVLEERQRIGMDLHDGAMQSLYGVGLLLEDAAERTPAAEARGPIERAVELLNGTIADMRRYVMGLRPIRGAERPLSESLPTLAKAVGDQARLDVRVDVDPDAERDLDPEQREAMFYVAADALTNVARHARATRANIRFLRKDGSAVLEVQDDGMGFDPAVRAPGLGLRNMRERAFVAGGRFEVGSRPGSGTTVRLELPLEGPAAPVGTASAGSGQNMVAR